MTENGNGAGGGKSPSQRLAELREEIKRIDGQMMRIRNQRERVARERDHLVKTYQNTPGISNPSKDQFYVKRQDVKRLLDEFFDNSEESKVDLAYRSYVNIKTIRRIMSEDGYGDGDYVTLRVADKLLTAMGYAGDSSTLQWYTEDGFGDNRRKTPYRTPLRAWQERQEHLQQLSGY